MHRLPVLFLVLCLVCGSVRAQLVTRPGKFFLHTGYKTAASKKAFAHNRLHGATGSQLPSPIPRYPCRLCQQPRGATHGMQTAVAGRTDFFAFLQP